MFCYALGVPNDGAGPGRVTHDTAHSAHAGESLSDV